MSKPSILLVDDDEDSRMLLIRLLDDGFHVRESSSGEDALHVLHARNAQCVFDLILMDIIMAGISGVEAIKRIRSGTYHTNTPIIAMTAYSDVPMAVHAMQAGANDFIEKPVAKNRLLKCIQQCLHVSARPSAHAEALLCLTAREKEVMSWLLQGEMNKQIAARLQISVRTVEAHRAMLKKKLHVKTVAELVRIGLLACTLE